MVPFADITDISDLSSSASASVSSSPRRSVEASSTSTSPSSASTAFLVSAGAMGLDLLLLRRVLLIFIILYFGLFDFSVLPTVCRCFLDGEEFKQVLMAGLFTFLVELSCVNFPRFLVKFLFHNHPCRWKIIFAFLHTLETVY